MFKGRIVHFIKSLTVLNLLREYALMFWNQFPKICGPYRKKWASANWLIRSICDGGREKSMSVCRFGRLYGSITHLIQIFVFLYSEMSEELKTLHATDAYCLKGAMRGDRLCLDLLETDKGFISKAYSGDFGLTDLPTYMQGNFTNFQNLKSYLTDSSHCRVENGSGRISLLSTLNLENGVAIELNTGQLSLSEYHRDKNQQLYEIVPIVYSEHDLPNHQIKLALQLFCKTIANLTEEIYKLKDSKSSSELPLEVLDPKKNLAEIKKSSLAIPKLLKDIDYATCRTGISKSNEVSDDLDAICEDAIPLNTSQELNGKFVIQKKTIDSMKVQIQENKQLLLKKLAKLQKKNSEVQSKIEKVLNSLASSRESEIILSDRATSEKPHTCTPLYQSTIQSKKENQDPEGRKNKEKIPQHIPISESVAERPRQNGILTPTYPLKHIPLAKKLLKIESQLEQHEHQQPRNIEIDMSAAYANQFLIKHNIAIYTGEDWTKTQLLGKQALSDIGQFKIRIRKSKRRYLWIGVADANYKDKRWSWGNPNWVYYCGWNGKVYEGPDQNVKTEGSGFRDGEVLTVRTDLQTGQIVWLVGSSVRARHTCSKLKNLDIKWVPLIKFFDHGDSIEWMCNDLPEEENLF